MRDLLFHVPDKFCLFMSALVAVQLAFALLRPQALPVLLARLTAPVLASVKWLTPAGAWPWLIACTSIFWLLVLRVVLHMQLGAWGLLPGQAAP